MPQLPLDCPFCRTKQAGFTVSQTCQFKPDPRFFFAMAQCQVCYRCVVLDLWAKEPQLVNFWMNGQILPEGNLVVKKVHPEQVTTAAPVHTPPNVARFYEQGMENLSLNFDAAGTMFRKCLDAALRSIDPDGKGTLEKRINTLDPSKGVTPAMKQWAHEIRDLGNDAAHEEDPFTESEARTLQAFTELFLTYAFTLPGMLAARKQVDGREARPS